MLFCSWSFIQIYPLKPLGVWWSSVQIWPLRPFLYIKKQRLRSLFFRLPSVFLWQAKFYFRPVCFMSLRYCLVMDSSGSWSFGIDELTKSAANAHVYYDKINKLFVFQDPSSGMRIEFHPSGSISIWIGSGTKLSNRGLLWVAKVEPARKPMVLDVSELFIVRTRLLFLLHQTAWGRSSGMVWMSQLWGGSVRQLYFNSMVFATHQRR